MIRLRIRMCSVREYSAGDVFKEALFALAFSCFQRFSTHLIRRLKTSALFVTAVRVLVELQKALLHEHRADVRMLVLAGTAAFAGSTSVIFANTFVLDFHL